MISHITNIWQTNVIERKKDIHVPIYTYTISHTVNIWQTNVIVMGKKKKKKKKQVILQIYFTWKIYSAYFQGWLDDEHFIHFMHCLWKESTESEFFNQFGRLFHMTGPE